MTKENQEAQERVKIPVKRNELIALHSCIAIVINNEIPSQSDCAFLMEAMTHLADQDKDTKKEFNLKIDEKYLKGLWYCCNIVLNNELQKDHVHAEEIITIMRKLAEEIDKLILMNKSPKLEIVK